MKIDGDWKNKVRNMRENGDNEGAKRELRKAKMSKEYLTTSDKNKIFIDYCLAHYAYKENNFDLANMYLENIERIFIYDKRNLIDLALEYSKYLWIKTNMNSTKMTLEAITKNMLKIYDYYYSIKMYDLAILSLANIYSLKGDGKMLLEKLDEFMNCPEISDVKFINSFLEDCEKISHNLYIEALEVIKKYNRNFNIYVV